MGVPARCRAVASAAVAVKALRFAPTAARLPTAALDRRPPLRLFFSDEKNDFFSCST